MDYSFFGRTWVGASTRDELRPQRRIPSLVVTRLASIATLLLMPFFLACGTNSSEPEEVARDYVYAIVRGEDASKLELAEVPELVARWSYTDLDIATGRTIRELKSKGIDFSGAGTVEDMKALGVPMAIRGASSKSCVYLVVTLTATLDDGTSRDVAVALRPRGEGAWGVVRKRP